MSPGYALLIDAAGRRMCVPLGRLPEPGHRIVSASDLDLPVDQRPTFVPVRAQVRLRSVFDHEAHVARVRALVGEVQVLGDDQHADGCLARPGLCSCA